MWAECTDWASLSYVKGSSRMVIVSFSLPFATQQRSKYLQHLKKCPLIDNLCTLSPPFLPSLPYPTLCRHHLLRRACPF